MNKYIASITYQGKKLYLRQVVNPDFLRSVLDKLLMAKTREEAQKSAERFFDPRNVIGSRVTTRIQDAEEFETWDYAAAVLYVLLALLPDAWGDCTLCIEELAEDGEILGEEPLVHYGPMDSYSNLMVDTLFGAIPHLHREQETRPIIAKFKK